MGCLLLFFAVLPLFWCSIRAGHKVCVGLSLYNGLDRCVKLKQCLKHREYEPSGFRSFEVSTLPPYANVCIIQNFHDYEAMPNGMPEQEIVRFHVYAGDEKIGSFRLLRLNAPEPCFILSNERINSKFRLQCCFGYTDAFEIVYNR